MVASIIPNAKNQFIDINGYPLVGGTVGMYIPNTLIFKNTWQNAVQTVLNADPIILDARGQALIYGNGTYRQIVKDINGNLILDQLVSAGSGGVGPSGAIISIDFSDSPYDLQPTDGVIFCDCTGGNIVINLLPADEFGSQLVIKKTDLTVNAITINADGSDTIDGTASYQMLFPNQSSSFQSNLVSYWGVI